MGGSAPIRLENTMDSLFNRNTDGVVSSEGAEPNTASQHAASDVSATVVNPLYAGETAGEHATPISSPAPVPDTHAYVAEPAPQQTLSTKECDGKQPGRATNLLLVATLAAVCGLAGGLAGGAIMSAATGGSTQTTRGGMGSMRGSRGGMQNGVLGTDDATTGGATGDSGEDSSENAAQNGQAPTDAPGAGSSTDTSTDSSNDISGDTSADIADSPDTSQTSLSA